MKQTAVQFLQDCLNIHFTFEQQMQFEGLFQQAKEMEKQQIIDAGNSCAIKQHLHNDMIDKMSNAEAMVFTQTDNLTFGEQYYNELYGK